MEKDKFGLELWTKQGTKDVTASPGSGFRLVLNLAGRPFFFFELGKKLMIALEVAGKDSTFTFLLRAQVSSVSATGILTILSRLVRETILPSSAL